MPPEETHDDGDVSLFALAHSILAARRRIAYFAIAGAVVALISIIWLRPLYKASATFVSSSAQSSNSGLAQAAGLAAQFGLALPAASNTAASPDFYVALVGSRALLGKILNDTIIVDELDRRKTTLLDLLEIKGANASQRSDDGVEALREMTATSIDKKTGIVQLEIKTRWPSVSLQIVQGLIDGLTEFNQDKRKSQARAEREFLDSRREIGEQDLRVAENQLEEFLRTNRQFLTSPQLTFESERLKRELLLRQQVYTGLALASEDARVREVRDLPLLTVIEVPQVRAKREPRGRVLRVIFGTLVGVIIGVCLCLIELMIGRARTKKDPDAEDFFSELESARSEIGQMSFWSSGGKTRNASRSSDATDL